MLYKILIKDIVLIKNLEIEFKPGLSVLTGETGTGKSILIDSLGLILGNRANFKLIRKGEKKGNVSAIFKINSNHRVNKYLASLNIDILDELIIRRDINIQGKSTSLINDVPVSITTLQRVGNLLVEIQGQFENHSLLNEKNHLELLDKFCSHDSLLNNVEDLWEKYISKKNELNKIIEQNEINQKNEEWVRDSLEQIQKIEPKENEEEELIKKRKFLINQDKIISSFESGRQILDSENGLNEQIKALDSVFNKLNDIDQDEIKKISTLINEVYINIEELTSSINSYNFNQITFKDDLENLEERLFELRTQANKHNCKIDDLVAIEKSLKIKLQKIQNDEKLITQLKIELTNCLSDYENASLKLSESRYKNSCLMMEKINNELPSLKLENAFFKIKLEKLSQNDYSKNGFDKVFFETRTNKGSNLGKLSDIASGGELSRFLLAIKVIVEKNLENKTLIFDEVDSGVGGATASAIGEKLLKIGEKYQTIVVTHSPQVSAKGVNHYLIIKEIIDDNTLSNTIELSESERIEEIARMLSDNKVTPEARNAAIKLLEN